MTTTTRSLGVFNPWVWITGFIIAMILLLALSGPGTAQAAAKITVPAGQLWTCHIPETQATVLSGPEMYTKQGRLMAVYRLDRNADGKMDMMLIHEVRGESVHRFPRYYVYDRNFDGQPDEAYADEMGNGICGEMTKVDPQSIVMERAEIKEGESCDMHEKEDPNNPKKEIFGDGTAIVVPGVRSLYISDSGTHYLMTDDDRKFIVQAGWLAIEIDGDWEFI